MKKITIVLLIAAYIFAYPSCNMCHNSRIAPKLDSMSAKEIKTKLLQMKKSNNINPKMAFVKNLSEDDIEKIIKQLKEKK